MRLDAQLQDIKDKLPKKGTLKKAEKVHEKVGRIKAKLSKICWLYEIKNIEPHIWLGIMAYQIVNYIRNGLKENNIDYNWTTILEKMKSMQSSIVSMNNKENEKIYVKLCTRPTIDQQLFFHSLDFKHRPFVRKTKVVPQL